LWSDSEDSLLESDDLPCDFLCSLVVSVDSFEQLFDSSFFVLDLLSEEESFDLLELFDSLEPLEDESLELLDAELHESLELLELHVLLELLESSEQELFEPHELLESSEQELFELLEEHPVELDEEQLGDVFAHELVVFPLQDELRQDSQPGITYLQFLHLHLKQVQVLMSHSSHLHSPLGPQHKHPVLI